MSDKRWKRAEREIARRVGGLRLPASGLEAPDVIAPGLSVEVKDRNRLPAWLKDAMVQAERQAPLGSLPIVVLHEAGQRYDDALVVLRLRSFLSVANAREAEQVGD